MCRIRGKRRSKRASFYRVLLIPQKSVLQQFAMTAERSFEGAERKPETKPEPKPEPGGGKHASRESGAMNAGRQRSLAPCGAKKLAGGFGAFTSQAYPDSGLLRHVKFRADRFMGFERWSQV